MLDIKSAFMKYKDDEYLEFKKIVNTSYQRPDLCAFLLLDKLVPGRRNIVSSAEHDEIWLDVEPKDLAKVATEEDILYLVRCGVMYDQLTDSLHMFA